MKGREKKIRILLLCLAAVFALRAARSMYKRAHGGTIIL